MEQMSTAEAAYWDGFVKTCEARGVDPEALCKASGWPFGGSKGKPKPPAPKKKPVNRLALSTQAARMAGYTADSVRKEHAQAAKARQGK
jgi:hypothetical protein